MNRLSEISFNLLAWPEKWSARWLTGWIWVVSNEEETPSGLDMGQGRTLSAEDVLEGHASRLTSMDLDSVDLDVANPDVDENESIAAPVQEADGDDCPKASDSMPLSTSPPRSFPVIHPRQQRSSAEEDFVGVKSDLTTAVHTLAPELLPYMLLADQIAELNRPARPSSKYRQLLQEALQAERDQLVNKRAIGIAPEHTHSETLLQSPRTVAAAIAAAVVIIITLGLYLWYPRSNKQ
ncbi:MAG: hypothetical protein AAF702_12310 [Chloroflexota bacterium]